MITNESLFRVLEILGVPRRDPLISEMEVVPINDWKTYLRPYALKPQFYSSKWMKLKYEKWESKKIEIFYLPKASTLPMNFRI